MLHFLRTAAVVALIACLGCSDRGGPADGTGAAGGSGESFRVVATTAMIGDVVSAVAGERAQVEVLIGPGGDPHQFRATRSHMASIARADLIFANGLRLEAKLLDSLQRTTEPTKLVLVGERIDPALLLSEQETGLPDPHLWMDPVRWATIVGIVEERLAAAMPGHAEEFAANSAAYTQRLEELQEYSAGVMATIPEEQRLLVTAHDAFGYLADRYGIRVEGIQGLSTDSEAGLHRNQYLVDQLVQRRVRAVFVESSVSDGGVRSLIQGAAARGHTVRIGGELYSDAMGAPGTYEGTYIGMLDHNVTTIARSLGGEAPEGGMSGRLRSQGKDDGSP